MPEPRRVTIVTPAGPGSRSGNRTTALRWAALLRQLSARVRITTTTIPGECDLVVAVHAVKSAPVVVPFVAARPATRLVVLLAGTDIYPTFAPDADAELLLERADAIVALQPLAAAALPAVLRSKVRTIVQSATAAPAPRAAVFRAAVLAHLRPVKQPMLAIDAMRHVPDTVTCELVLAGRAMTDDARRAVEAATARDPHIRWLGELPRRRAKELLSSSHVVVVPSSAEGGANVVSEAIAAATPVLCSDIPGNLGLLGDDWPGRFVSGDPGALGALLHRAATDADFLTSLRERTDALLPLVDPTREREAWRTLLHDLA